MYLTVAGLSLSRKVYSLAMVENEERNYIKKILILTGTFEHTCELIHFNASPHASLPKSFLFEQAVECGETQHTPQGLQK